MISVLRDTTQHQLERISAERHDADMQALLDSLDIGLCLADRHGRILVANSRLASLLGHRAYELRPGTAVADAFARLARSGDPGKGAGIASNRSAISGPYAAGRRAANGKGPTAR
jgi:PAS domain-containing protein